MFNQICENKTRMYMKGFVLKGELNGNAERMWHN